MYKLRNLLESIYAPLWILKDFMWFMGLGVLSFIFAIPTILISIILIGYTSGIRKKEHIIVGLWVTANTLWMTNQTFGWKTDLIAIIFYLIGILVSLSILPHIIEKYTKD